MTPKLKAEQLINKFRPHSKYWDCYNDEPLEENHAKQCALIAVDEILNHDNGFIQTSLHCSYWEEVKEILENKL
jgi:hypothetical protein